MTEQSERAASFGAVAAAYERGRPGYPRQAAAWVAGTEPATVLELGAGTGKLTTELVALGHDVHATDPSPAMLGVLAAKLPTVPVAVAPAEHIPLPDHSVDVVVAAQSFHWFDHDRALPEIARVLRPGGRLGVLWNDRDERIPWVRRLGALLDATRPDADPVALLTASELFAEPEQTGFAFWQYVDADTIEDLAHSHSVVAVLDEPTRRRRLAQVRAFYDDYGRGADGMQLPYRCTCLRAQVTGRRPVAPEADERPDAESPLIDFR